MREGGARRTDALARLQRCDPKGLLVPRARAMGAWPWCARLSPQPQPALPLASRLKRVAQCLGHARPSPGAGVCRNPRRPVVLPP